MSTVKTVTSALTAAVLVTGIGAVMLSAGGVWRDGSSACCCCCIWLAAMLSAGADPNAVPAAPGRRSGPRPGRCR